MIPLVSTPTRVDLPLSTFPITATLTSDSSLTYIVLSNWSSYPSKSFDSSASYSFVNLFSSSGLEGSLLPFS